MKVLSYNLLIETDCNRIFSGPLLTEADFAALKAADAVILPQPCREVLYRTAKRFCAHVFPDYDAFFDYPGKIGQYHLFREIAVPHPRTTIFGSLQDYSENSGVFSFPVVFKFSWGGEGKNVFLLRSYEDLDECLEKAYFWESNGKQGFVLQEYIPTNGRSLRVVVIGNEFFSYWRVGSQGDFYTNLAKGAAVDCHSSPDLQKKAVELLRDFCHKTKINLAGFDFLFTEDPKDPRYTTPLFLEINYCFRCRGLGGPGHYHHLLGQSVRSWIKNLIGCNVLSS